MYRDSVYIIYHTSIYVVNTIFHDTKKWHPKVKKEQPSLSESCSLIYSSFFSDILCNHRCCLFYNYSFPRYFLSCRRRQIKKQYFTQKLSFFIYIPQIILFLIVYTQSVLPIFRGSSICFPASGMINLISLNSLCIISLSPSVSTVSEIGG